MSSDANNWLWKEVIREAHVDLPSKGMCFHVEVGLSISFLVLARVCVFISRSNDLIARLLLVSVSSKVGVSASKSW